jgi:hypothetical protein
VRDEISHCLLIKTLVLGPNNKLEQNKKQTTQDETPGNNSYRTFCATKAITKPYQRKHTKSGPVIHFILQTLTIAAATSPKQPVDSFTYEPLDESRQQIRLLHIYRGAAYTWLPISDTEFGCDLSTYSTIDNSIPNYVSLSYTWGNPTPMRSIWMNGRRLTVRKNLFDFRECFSHNEENAHHPYIWIDQISIDQTNEMERNEQVRRMPDIYRCAKWVIIWLDLSSRADFRKFKIEREHYAPPKERTPFKTNYKAATRAAVQILCNRYFSRLWVVQEILLASKLRLFCGSD